MDHFKLSPHVIESSKYEIIENGRRLSVPCKKQSYQLASGQFGHPIPSPQVNLSNLDIQYIQVVKEVVLKAEGEPMRLVLKLLVS